MNLSSVSPDLFNRDLLVISCPDIPGDEILIDLDRNYSLGSHGPLPEINRNDRKEVKDRGYPVFGN